jgi:hypothetical protein
VFKKFIYLFLFVFFSCSEKESSIGADPSEQQANDGKSALINVIYELPGSNCEYGGIKIESGVDEDSSGVLDFS